MTPRHRSISLHEALHRARGECARLGLEVTIGSVGGNGHKSAVVRLHAVGERVATGFGKGIGTQGLVGAYFEALERYYTSASIIREGSDGELRLLATTVINSQPALAKDALIRRWADDFPNSRAGCAEYHNAVETVWYPAFLVDPLYESHMLPGDSLAEYRSLLRYTVSIGTAAGTSRTEAMLHGLCELIEHDSVSIALIRWFLLGERRIRRVGDEHLARVTRQLMARARAAAGTPVLLLDITTDLGVPSYLALAETADGMSTVAGAGASVDGQHAADQALKELIQLVTFPSPPARRDPIQRLVAWRALEQCARLSVPWLVGGDVSEVALPPPPTARTVAQSLRLVTSRLNLHDMQWFWRELTSADADISVVATLAPGLERFSLVRFGVPVLPTGRGVPIWDSAKAARTI